MAPRGPDAVFFFREFALTLSLLRTAPKQIIAGDSIEFLVGIPSDLAGWTGSARLTGPSQMDATSCATEDGNFHVLFEGQSASGTKTLPAGQYTLTVWATSANNRYTVAQYQLTVVANLATGTPAQSHAQKMLALLETAIYNRVNGNSDGGIENYAIDGTAVSKLSMEQLQKMRARYAAEVSREQNPTQQIGRVPFAFTQGGSPVGVNRRYG